MVEKNNHTVVEKNRKFSRAVEILHSAKKNGAEILLINNELQLKLKENQRFDEKLLEDIRDNKSLLIEFLGRNNLKSERIDNNYNKIKKIDRENVENIPLSFSQERLWFIDQLEGSVQYHIPDILRLQGDLNQEGLIYALQTIVNRHEVLRTVIRDLDGEGYQYIKEKDKWNLHIIDGHQYRQNPDALSKYIKSLIIEPFDLSRDYLIRGYLIDLGEKEHILLMILHHIASDAWSKAILVKEVAEIYRSFIEKRDARLSNLEIQYADYAVWQRNYLQGELLAAKLNYWRKKLEGVKPLQMPTDYARPVVQSNKGATLPFVIGDELSEELQMLSKQTGATTFMMLLAALNVLFYRYTGQGDICIGTPIAGRQQPEVESLIGFFVNTLALRNKIIGEKTFIELLQQVKTTTMEAYENLDVPFEKVVEAIVKERDQSRTPIFQVLLVLQNTPDIPKLKIGELIFSRESSEHTTAKFDLTFTVSETKSGLRGSIHYNTDLYKKETIARMTNNFKELFGSIIKNPREQIGKLKMLTVSQEHQLLEEFNGSQVIYPKDACIVDLFEAQVQKTPDKTAVIFEEESLTYLELNQRANQLAHYLRQQGVKNETLVPLCIERSVEMIVGIWGILKAGGAYVPIDPEYPEDRIGCILEDIMPAVMVSSQTSRKKLQKFKTIEIVEANGEIINDQPYENLQVSIAPNNLVYVIYTSGSTGIPKGVMIEHRALLDHCFGLIKEAHLDMCNSFALFAPLVFDAGHSIIFSSLLVGASLNVLSMQLIVDGEKLKSYLNNHPVDCIKIVPSVWLSYINDNNIVIANKVMIFGGETFSGNILAHLRNINFKGSVYNHYGPTEATIGKCLHRVNLEKSYGNVPLGKPFSNTRVYIVDEWNQIVPIGVTGELYIAGDGLARGYYNLPELTAEKFISNPFSAGPGERVYKTGDRARWSVDGEIEYLGRGDEQVKIRGRRIELREIENVLLNCNGVKTAAVNVDEDNHGNKILVGYIITDGVFDKKNIVTQLRAKLPEYMIPGNWVELDQMPLTSNGKVDKKALVNPHTNELTQEKYTAPNNEFETELVNIWQEILHCERVGISDNFFEIGGHSLLAMRLVSAIRRKLKIEFTINDIFIHPTIGGFAQNYIEKVKNPSLPLVNIKHLIPLKTEGFKIPIYIICGEGGTALRFKKFSEFMNFDQPVYALQGPVDYERFKDFPTTIEAIAKTFIQEILINNPVGPYALAGHCQGGIIAFEMAKQLKDKGKKVHLLAMFDTVIRKPVERQPATFKNFYHLPSNFKKSVSKVLLKLNFESFLLTRHTKHAIRYKLEKLKLLFNKFKNRKRIELNDLEHIGLDAFQSKSIYLKASKDYKMTPYDGGIILFYAKERYYFNDIEKKVAFKKINLKDSTKNLWSDFAKNIKIYETQGDHSTMFEPEHANEFAKILQQYLNE